MADRPRIYDGQGMIGNLPDLKLTKEGKLTALVAQALLNAVNNLLGAVNGKLTFGGGANSHQAGNLDAQWIEWYFTTANAEEIIPHGLGRVVVGYSVWRWDKAARVYDSNAGSWDEKHFRLKCDTSGVSVRMLVV